MQDSTNTQNLIENKGEDIRFVVFGYRQYNIVHCQGLYYGWPWPAGGFSLEGYMSGTFPTAVVGKSIMDVKTLVDEKLGPPIPEEENQHDWIAEQEMEAVVTGLKINKRDDDIRQVVSGYRQYNIVYCQGLYFGWSCSAEGFSLEKYLSRTVYVAVIGKSIMSVKNIIDVKFGPPTVEEESQHDWMAIQQNEAAGIAFNIQEVEVEVEMIKKIPRDRFLLIKQWGYGLWADVHDVCAKLLLSELINREPIIYWGKNSFYSVDENHSSFEQYFLPVSNYSISDVVSGQFTYYPPVWNSYNYFQTDPFRFSNIHRDPASFVNCGANVLVSDTFHNVHEFIPWIKEGHPAYGLDEDAIYRYLLNKYFNPQPYIVAEIDEFYHTHMQTGPILAAHVRGGAKFYEVPDWDKINAQYPHEIDCYLKDNPSGRIFLLTDDEAILEQYKQMYGNILIYTDCTRKTIADLELCLKVFPDKRRKGIEIIKDTYLACKCDYFIGNRGSNVAVAISRMKNWEKDKIKLLWL